MKLIKRKETADGWLYDDPDEQSLAAGALFAGFDLARFDTFLISLGDSPSADELFELRKNALDAHKTNNQPALKIWLNAMTVSRFQVLYDDPDEQALGSHAAPLGFDLFGFDSFLLALGDSPRADQLRAWRTNALDAHKTNNELALKMCLNAMIVSWFQVRRDDAVLPKARQGAKQSAGARKAASAPRTDMSVEQQKLAAKEYRRRLSAGERYGAVKELAAEYDVSTQTIRDWAKKHK